MNDRHPDITIVRRLKASPEKVYAAITQVDQVLQWWGPDAGPAVSAEIDLRPSGRYSVVFRLMDGSEHNPRGVYREVVPNEKLAFTWEWPNRPDWESLVTIRLRPIDIGTELTLTHEKLPNDDAIESHRAGWTGWVGELETYLEEE
ncbi:SRPBCC family protein [Chelativorans salis]|uniref:SRPBCC domain-containing protein n=1 Tax=Chelativorans salis TaxID=2978478 RepID=A0ABT2LUT7_9HYPH|nr:SRPBCC domain-containing protein [Chelativorans sp. EGI FJ00035]MCT7378296.1 SRPBCC domain-containing protein [Chelativorans sp. EGI FJ00035]